MSDATVVFGLHAVRVLLQRHATKVVQLSVQRGREDARINEVIKLAREQNIKIEQRNSHDMDQLVQGESHQGVIAQLKKIDNLGEGALDDVLDRAGDSPLVLVLDGVTDPHNLGACLRTADAAGVNAVIVPRDRAAGLSPVVRKVAAGAAETVPLIQVTNLARTLRWLKERGLWLVGTDDEATQSIYAAKLTGPLAVVMGAEGAGMRRLTREHCDLLVTIPMQGVVESLNVSVATGVTLYEVVRQRSVTG
ncbi:MAG TPA: 23S rRNA (guanosine(2251)-2'-O)-methyltransferase RlmB [Steroidobacteraceae bacterium]|nr:23S rRNA (guanosine(2251)-2'-O)-methyltransferase RlmB [Steroidobacteraceae bacterium]